MIRYFRPASSECSCRTRLPQRMYSGIESSSIPMKIVTRFCAPASRTIPPIEPSRSDAYSPGPVSRTTADRSESRVVAMPAA